MIFKVTNHSLCFIPVVHIRRDKLEFCLPGLGDNLFEVGAGLVISDVGIHREPAHKKASHDVIEGWYTMFVCLCREGLLQD